MYFDRLYVWRAMGATKATKLLSGHAANRKV